MDPVVLRNVFDSDLRARLLDDCDWVMRRGYFVQDEAKYGRIISQHARFAAFAERLLPTAQRIFGRTDILPSYALWARYSSPDSALQPHTDNNACTYTLDYCVRQQEPWDLYVEGVPYVLQENDALAFMGEDQEHWRSPWSYGNMVEMVFFHYVAPDHWYFE